MYTNNTKNRHKAVYLCKVNTVAFPPEFLLDPIKTNSVNSRTFSMKLNNRFVQLTSKVTVNSFHEISQKFTYQEHLTDNHCE